MAMSKTKRAPRGAPRGKTAAKVNTAAPQILERPPGNAVAAKTGSSGRASKKSAAVAIAPDASVDNKQKPKKAKVIRDSFTMPKPEYDVIDQIKQKCLAQGVHVKKSELLRAGVAQLAALPLKKLIAAVGALETVQTGRPKK